MFTSNDIDNIKKMENMNLHDLYNYIFNDMDLFTMLCLESLELLRIPFHNKEFNKNLDSVMGELLIQEAKEYNVHGMGIAEFLEAAENIQPKEYNYLYLLSYYFERLKCYPNFYKFDYKVQEVKQAYFDIIELTVKYREFLRRKKVQEYEENGKFEQAPSIENGYCLAKYTKEHGGSKKWFTHQDVIDGMADDYDYIEYMTDGKKRKDKPNFTKDRLESYLQRITGRLKIAKPNVF